MKVKKGLYLELMTPEEIAFKGNADYIQLPAYEGEVGILQGHAPLLALLLQGETLIRSRGRDIWLATGDGFVQVLENRVSVLVFYATRPENVNVEEIEREILELEKKISAPGGAEERKALIKLRDRRRQELKVAGR
jgi:F-type H+-transporting ATPase subunit epsilon